MHHGFAVVENQIGVGVIGRLTFIDEDQLISPVIADKPRRGIDHQRGTADDEHIGLGDGTDGILDGLAVQSLKVIFEYLPRAYDNGQTDVEAREKMANAATIAGMAFANAFLGVCHSMAHKLGAFHHLPHGVANALMIEEVLRFNASEAPAKMGTFSQYDHPHTLERYAEIADYLGLGGKTNEQKLDNLRNSVSTSLENIRRDNNDKLESIRKTVDERLEKSLENVSSVTDMLSLGKSTRELIMEIMKDFEIDILDETEIEYNCDCSLERMERAIISLGKEEIQNIIDEQGEAEIVCQFCDRKYLFDKHALESFKNKAKR